MSQVDEGLVHAWLDGALPADEAARIEQLVASDAAWGAAAAEARGLIANATRLVRALDDGVTSGGRPTTAPPRPALQVTRGDADRVLRLGRRIGAIAAVLVVAVVGRTAWMTSRIVVETVPAVVQATVPRAVEATSDQTASSQMSEITPTPQPATAPAATPSGRVAVAAAGPAAPPSPVAAPPSLETVASREAADAAAERAAVPQVVVTDPGAALSAIPARRLAAAPAAANASEAAAERSWFVAGACVRVVVLWNAEGDLPPAHAEILFDGPQTRAVRDSVRLEAPMPSQRADGTPVATRVRLAVHRRDGRGVAELVRPDSSVARRGQVEQARRCP